MTISASIFYTNNNSPERNPCSRTSCSYDRLFQNLNTAYRQIGIYMLILSHPVHSFPIHACCSEAYMVASEAIASNHRYQRLSAIPECRDIMELHEPYKLIMTACLCVASAGL